MKRLTSLLVVGLVAVGCGSSPSGPVATVQDAEHSLATLSSGRIALQFDATGGEGSRGTGFSVVGPYRYGKDTYPVLDLTSVNRAGRAQGEVRLRSTGRAVFVTSAGHTTRLTDAQAAKLRLGDGKGAVGDLGIAGWVVDPKERTSGKQTVVTGSVDVADLLSDLARVAGQVAGSELSAPDKAAAERLRKLVKTSHVELVTEGNDHELRKLDLTVTLEPQAGADLRRALGATAGATLHLLLTVDPLDGAFNVDPPA